MVKKRKGISGIWYGKKLLTSISYQQLSASAIRVLNQFYLKRQLFDSKTAESLKIDRDSALMVRNNKEIIFTYSEAKIKCGIKSNGAFTKAIDKLIEVGFIEMAKQGGNHLSSKFSISDRWGKYGTPEFKVKKRLKLKNQVIGKESRFKKKNSDDEKQNSPCKSGVITHRKSGVINRESDKIAP